MNKKTLILESLNKEIYYSSELPSLKSNGSGMGMALCPFHEDHKPSLSVNLNTGQFNCFGCDRKGSIFDFYMAKHGVDYRTALEELSKRAGLPTDSKSGKTFTEKQIKEIVLPGDYKFSRIHTYKMGNPQYKKAIYKNDSGNNQAQFFTLLNGEKNLYTKGRKSRPVLYNEELLEGRPNDLLFVSESEKDCDNLLAIGFLAVSSGGSQSWINEFSDRLQGRDVVILPHNDEAGSIFAEKVTTSLRGKTESIKILDATLFGNFRGADISDWLAKGGTKEKLFEIIKETPEWILEKKTSEQRHHFSLIQAKDLLSIEESEIGWLWEGILPAGGLSLLVAKPKVGKTTLAFNLAVAVSRGNDFLGRKTQKADVIYLALEEKRGELQKKLKALGIKEEGLYFHFGPAPIEAMKEVEPLIKETKAKLLVIDIFQKFVRIKDINDYAQVTRALEPLMAIARQEDCHILMTHHAGKTERTDGDDILGSTGLLGGVDTSIHLKKKDQRRTLFTIQRYEEDFPETVITLLPDGSLEATGSREEVEIKEAIPLILEVLKDVSLTEKDIWDGVEKSHTLVSKALRKLVDRGEIKRSGSGKKGDPYLYEKNSLFLSSVYIGESKREFLSEDNSLKTQGLFSPDDFQKNGYPSRENREGISGPKETPKEVDLDLEKEEVEIVE